MTSDPRHDDVNPYEVVKDAIPGTIWTPTGQQKLTRTTLRDSEIGTGGDYSLVDLDGAYSPVDLDGAYSPVDLDGAYSPVDLDGAYSLVDLNGDYSLVDLDGAYSLVDLDGDYSLARCIRRVVSPHYQFHCGRHIDSCWPASELLSSSSSYARRRCLSPSRKRLSSSAPPCCHKVCPSVASVLATCPASEQHVAGSAAVDVLQS